MKVGADNLDALRRFARLDAGYFLSPGYTAARRLKAAKDAGFPVLRLGGPRGIAKVWQPNRFKRLYAAPGETAIPYIRPYGIFQYLPQQADALSPRTKNLTTYRLRKGMILQTCSGRNLGPLAVVDSYLERFVPGHDLLRIEVPDEATRNYVLAFLSGPTGQTLVRRDKSGSVIDHITEEHMASQEIPVVEDRVFERVAEDMGNAVRLREEARVALASALASYEASLPSPDRGRPMKEGWTVRATSLTPRLDAASYDPWVAAVRAALLDAGGKKVSEVADVLKPAGRYKTLYVEPEHGRPILSGSQVLQVRPVNLRHISPRALKDPRAYELRAGWSVYQADGRAEESLGIPAMVTPDREGWLASGHVGRLVPREGTDPGWLYLASRTWHVQAQIKSLASGSVVDSTFPEDMESVVLPPKELLSADGAVIMAAWMKFAEAEAAEGSAIKRLESALESY